MIVPGKIKLLITLFLSLIALNLTVGVIAYRNLAVIDRDYTRILEQLIPFQDNMRTVSLQATRTLAYTMLYANEKVHEAGREIAIKQTGEVSDKIYKLMEKGPFPSEELKHGFEDVRAKRVLWRSHLATYLNFLHSGKDTDANTTLNERLYPALLNYLTGRRFGHRPRRV